MLVRFAPRTLHGSAITQFTALSSSSHRYGQVQEGSGSRPNSVHALIERKKATFPEKVAFFRDNWFQGARSG